MIPTTGCVQDLSIKKCDTRCLSFYLGGRWREGEEKVGRREELGKNALYKELTLSKNIE